MLQSLWRAEYGRSAVALEVNETGVSRSFILTHRYVTPFRRRAVFP